MTCFWGLPRSHSDINVLEWSSVFFLLIEWRSPQCNYSINENDYTMGYQLADGISPKWLTFVKTIPSPQGNKQIHFAKAQDSTRKDIKQAFGVLQARFAIVQGLSHFLERETLKDVMKACIILHNMIVEDKQNVNEIDFNYDVTEENPHLSVSQECTIKLFEFIQTHHRIRDKPTHSSLQANLVEHLWQIHGAQLLSMFFVSTFS